MSDEPSHLDNIKHKLKHMANKHIDKLSKHIKFNTLNKKDKDNNNNCEPRPKVIKPKKPALAVFWRNFWMGLVITIIIVLINANITYIIKYGDEILNSWFPDDCKKYPYGTSNKTPCIVPGLDVPQAEKLIRKLQGLQEKKSPKVARPSGAHSPKGHSPKAPPTKAAPTKTPAKPPVGGGNVQIADKAAVPYNLFDYSSEDSLGIGAIYLNGILSVLAYTNAGIYGIVKLYIGKIIKLYENTHEKYKDLLNTLLILFGIIITAPISLVGIGTFISMSINQYMQIMSNIFNPDEWKVLILVFILLLPLIFIWFPIVATYNQIIIFLKFSVYPLLEYSEKIGEILKKQMHVIAWLIAGVFIYALLSTPLDKHYSGLVKGVTATTYIVFLLWIIILYLYNLIK